MKYTLNLNANKYVAAQSLLKRWRAKRKHWQQCIEEEVTELYEVGT